MVRSYLGVGVALLAIVPACVRQLPPAPIPEAVKPPLDTSAPIESGNGRLVIDVVDGPVPVERVSMQPQQIDEGFGHVSFRFDEAPEPLCTAPCIADLPQGNVLLGFPVIGKSSLETELVHVGPDATVYRRSLSVYTDHTGALRVLGIIGASVGSAALITGAVLLPIGLDKDLKGLTTAGGITLGAGAALLAFGIWAIRHDAPTYRPGSSNHFPL